MRSSLLLISVAAAALGAATTASAQYRSDMPSVSTPRPAADIGAPGREALAEFSRWNRAHGNPPMLVLWDRTFSDEATTRTRARLSEDVVTAAAPGVVVTQRDVVVGSERIADDHTPGMNSGFSADLEDAYLQSMLGVGASIMDRNTLMRRASLGVDRTDRADQQFLETLAVDQGVRYLIEVLPQFDSRSATGVSTTIKITDLSTARIVARFVTAATPPQERRRLVAGPGGFRREGEDTPTARDIGAQLALESLTRLSSTR